MLVDTNAPAVAGHATRALSGPVAAIIAFAAVAPAILMTAPAVAAQLALQLQLDPARIGNLFSAELGAMSLATLPAYAWMRRVDWRHAAAFWALVFIGANLASAAAPSYAALLGLRALSALGGGSLMVLCLASAARMPNPDRVYGLWVMGQLVLGAAGRAVLPGLFAHYGLTALYVLLAILMAAALPLARRFPTGGPDTAAAGPRAPQAGGWMVLVIGIAALLGFYMSLGGVWTFIGAIAQAASIPADASGEVLAVATLCGIAGAALAAWIGQRGSRMPVLLAGYALMLAAIALLAGRPGIARYAAAAFLFKFAWTFALPFILASLAAADRSGRLINAANLVIGGGLALGPLLAGHLIQAGGFVPMLATGFALGMLSLVLLAVLVRRKQ
jgi:predicted MFS family arabinose efflux permease